MNERNVAYNADSLYPRDRAINMSDKQNHEFEEVVRKGNVGERRKASVDSAPHKISGLEAQNEFLREILSKPIPENLGVGKDVIDFLANGKIPKKEAVNASPPPADAQDLFRSNRAKELVFEEESGATGVETDQLLQYSDKQTVEKALEEMGRGAPLPENWDSMDAIHRGRWLQNEQEIFSFRKVDMSNKKDTELPAMAGGSGEIYWDDPLREEIKEFVGVDPDTKERIYKKELRTIGIEETIKRLVILQKLDDLKDMPVDTGNDMDKIEKDAAELKAFLKLNYTDRVNDAMAHKRNYDLVSKFAKATTEMSRKYELADKSEVFDKVLPFNVRDNAREVKRDLDKHFQEIKDKNPAKYKELFKVLSEEASLVNKAQDTGWYGSADMQARKNEFKNIAQKEIEKAASDEEREITRWQAERYEEGFDLRFGEAEIYQAPGDWKDSKYNVDIILRHLERTKFSEQQLSKSFNAAIGIVTSIPIDKLEGDEKREATKLQDELTHRVNSIIAVNAFHTILEHATMKPDDAQRAIGGFEDDTFEIFIERFSKDAKGHDLKYTVKEGDETKEKELNLFSVGMNLYMKRLNREKRIMNYVEKWTKDSKVKPGADEQGLEDRCLDAIADIKGRTGGSRDVGKIKEAIQGWYSDNTLVGSYTEHNKVMRESEMVGDLRIFDELKGEELDRHNEWKEHRIWGDGMVEELIKNKEAWNLTEVQIKEMVQSGMIEQVMNNAHRFSWMHAYSDYNGIRIWDPNAETPNGGRGRVTDFVMSGDTNLFHATMIDHGLEFLIVEGRGGVGTTNWILQDELLGENGNLLSQNRTMVRFSEGLLGKDVVDTYVQNKIDGTNTKQLKNIDKVDTENEDEMHMVRAASISDGIESGELSFENADWAKFYDGSGSYKYKYIDLFGDRAASMNFIGDPLQTYLETPNSKTFFALFSKEKFSSKRMQKRLKPMMKLVIPVHIKIGATWKKYWHDTDKMAHAEKEEVIEYAVRSNRLDVKYDGWMREKYLGWGGVPGYAPVRAARRLAEAADIGARVGSETFVRTMPLWPWYFGKAYVGNLLKYLTS